LAGPSDVQKETEIVRDEIERWNTAHSRTHNAFLVPIHWDTHAFPEIGDRAQALINRQIVDRCDLLVAIFWKNLGSPTGVADSGTVEEISRFRKSNKPVMIYFSEAPVPQNCDLAALQKLHQYKTTLTDTLYASFKSPKDLRRKFSVHLPQALARLLNGSQDNRAKQNVGYALNEKLAQLNRIKVELITTPVSNDFPKVIKKLRPLLLDCCGLTKVSRIKEARDNIQSLLWRLTQLERFSFTGEKLEDFHKKRDRLFLDIRRAFEQASAIEELDDWEIARYEDLKTKHRKDTKETAWNWPEDKQCQCEDCKEFRDLKRRLRDNLNPSFRAFVLELVKDVLRLQVEKEIDGGVDAWLRSKAAELRIFEERFFANEQFENAEFANRAAHTFESLLPEDIAGGFLTDFTDQQHLARIASAVQPLRDLLGPW